jgi:glycosyltransferase involved in cell wall biosynthesis
MPTEFGAKRVAIVTGANLGTRAPGGTRTYVLGLVHFLDAQKVGVDLISNGPTEALPESCRIFEVSPEFIPSARGFQKRLRSWAKNVDFAHVGLLHFQRLDDLWALRSELRRIPSICTLHGNPRVSIRRRRGFLQSLVYGVTESRSIYLLRAIIAVDGNTAKAYRQLYPRLASRIQVIPVAVDYPRFHSQSNGVADTAGRPPVFLFAGRLSPEKRVHWIIDAVKACSVTGAQLSIAGSGPEEPALRAHANGSAVRFIGDTSQRSLADLYRQADALVLASEYEGIPTVALESLASGCPVVAISAEWSRNLPIQSGLVIAQDAGKLPGALMEAVRLRASRLSIDLPAQFRWPRVGREILDVYRRVAPAVVP